MDHLRYKRILIVENEATIYHELVSFFRGRDLLVITPQDPNDHVKTYEEAVNLVDLYSPDIIVLDVELNGTKNGLDVCRYVRTLDKPVVVVMLTSFGEHFDEAAWLLPEGYYIKTDKPFDKENLLADLDELARRAFRNQDYERVLDIVKLHTPREDRINGAKGRFFTVLDRNHPARGPIHRCFYWVNVTYISSFNRRSFLGHDTNNRLEIHVNDSTSSYIISLSLSEMMEFVPDSFIRTDRSTIINICVAEPPIRLPLFKIGADRFVIKKAFRRDAILRLEKFGITGL